MYRILIADDEPMALYSTAHAFPWADWGFDPPVYRCFSGFFSSDFALLIHFDNFLIGGAD